MGQQDASGKTEEAETATGAVNSDWPRCRPTGPPHLHLRRQYGCAIELFFRWLKCILGCRHLLTENQAGVTIQVYLAIIASLLIGLWTGAKPSKRTYEMLCHYFNGWATAEEVERHLKALQPKTGPPSKP